MDEKNNNKLMMTTSTATYNAINGRVTYTDQKHKVADVLKACQNEDVVSREAKKEALKTIERIEKECSSEMIKEFDNLLTALYSIALEDGFSRF